MISDSRKELFKEQIKSFIKRQEHIEDQLLMNDILIYLEMNNWCTIPQLNRQVHSGPCNFAEIVLTTKNCSHLGIQEAKEYAIMHGLIAIEHESDILHIYNNDLLELCSSVYPNYVPYSSRKRLPNETASNRAQDEHAVVSQTTQYTNLLIKKTTDISIVEINKIINKHIPTHISTKMLKEELRIHLKTNEAEMKNSLIVWEKSFDDKYDIVKKLEIYGSRIEMLELLNAANH